MRAVSRPLFQILQGHRLLAGVCYDQYVLHHNFVLLRIDGATAPFYLCPSELDKLFSIEIKSAPCIRKSPLVLSEYDITS
jgi:hypothetical protein